MGSGGNRGFLRVWRAFGFSFQGMRAAFVNEAAFRQELFVFILIAPLGIVLGRTGVERALLVGSWVLVLVVELLNSAIEATVDRFGEEHHDLAGRAKDMGSAAVLIAIGLSILTWILLLADSFFAWA